MNQLADAVVFWGALVASLVVYALGARYLLREIRRGKRGRLAAVIVCGLATPVLGMVPIFIAYVARFVASLAGFSVLPKESADDGVMVGIGIIGMLMAMGAAALFSVVMIFQALTGSDDSHFDAKD